MCDDHAVRTTLDIDNDILQAAKEIAATQRSTAGKVLSELARRALAPGSGGRRRERQGVPVLPARQGATPVTLEIVNRLRDEAP
jgi:hypothetical protein